MNEILVNRTEFLSNKFIAHVFLKGDSLVINIIGPNDHLGGIGVGMPYIRKNGDLSANFHCISLPSHRDGEVAATFSRIIAKLTRRFTIVILGIHFPNLTQNQVNDVVSFFEKWAVEIGESVLSNLSVI